MDQSAIDRRQPGLCRLNSFKSLSSPVCCASSCASRASCAMMERVTQKLIKTTRPPQTAHHDERAWAFLMVTVLPTQSKMSPILGARMPHPFTLTALALLYLNTSCWRCLYLDGPLRISLLCRILTYPCSSCPGISVPACVLFQTW